VNNTTKRGFIASNMVPTTIYSKHQ